MALRSRLTSLLNSPDVPRLGLHDLIYGPDMSTKVNYGGMNSMLDNTGGGRAMTLPNLDQNETGEVIRIGKAKKQRADSVAGLNQMRMAGQAPLSGLHSEKEYIDSLNDDISLSSLLGKMQGGPSLHFSAHYQPVAPDVSNDPTVPNWSTPGEVGGKNKAARLFEQGVAEHEEDKKFDKGLKTREQSNKDMEAQANTLYTNARTLRELHPNFQFHTVNGRVAAFDPTNPNTKIDLGDANLLSPDALEQKKQMELFNQGQITNREISLENARAAGRQALEDSRQANRLELQNNKNTPEKQPSASQYAAAHKQAIQNVLSDPANAGMFSNIVTQPDVKNNIPYTVKGIDSATSEDDLFMHKTLLDKINQETNKILGKRDPYDINLPKDKPIKIEKIQ